MRIFKIVESNRKKVLQDHGSQIKNIEKLIALIEELLDRGTTKMNNLIYNSPLQEKETNQFVWVNTFQQLFNLIAALELTKKSIVLPARSVIRTVMETLLRDIYALLETESSIIQDMKEWYTIDILDDNKAKRKWSLDRKFAFSKITNKMYDSNQLEGIKKVYRILSEATHGKPTSSFYNLVYKENQVKQNLDFIRDLAIWTLFVFLMGFAHILPINEEVQIELFNLINSILEDELTDFMPTKLDSSQTAEDLVMLLVEGLDVSIEKTKMN